MLTGVARTTGRPGAPPPARRSLLPAVAAHVAAELRQRWRDRRWPALLMLYMLLAAGFLPPPGARYATFLLDGARPLYTPGFVGTAGALLTNAVLGLAGLFLVGTTVWRDQSSGLGRLVAATPVRPATFLFGRWLAGTLTLWSMAAAMLGVLSALLVVRGGAASGLPHLAAAYLVLTLPALALVAGVALALDCWLPPSPGVRALAGSGAWVLLQVSGLLGLPGPLGYNAVQRTVVAFVGPGAGWQVGYLPVGAALPAVAWQGVPVTGALLAQGAAWLLAALGTCLLPAPGFHRFDPDRAGAGARLAAPATAGAVPATAGAAPNPAVPAARPVSAQAQGSKPATRAGTEPAHARAPVRPGALLPRVLAEWWLLTRMAPAWKWLAVAALAAGALLPGPTHWLAAAVLWLPLTVLGPLACREEMEQTAPLLFSLPGLQKQYLRWKVATAAAVAVAPALGLLARLALVNPAAALGLLTGLLFTACWLVAAARLSRGPLLGLVSTGLLWYVAALNPVPAWLDYAGLWHPQALAARAAWLLLAAALLLPGRAAAPRG